MMALDTVPPPDWKITMSMRVMIGTLLALMVIAGMILSVFLHAGHPLMSQAWIHLVVAGMRRAVVTSGC